MREHARVWVPADHVLKQKVLFKLNKIFQRVPSISLCSPSNGTSHSERDQGERRVIFGCESLPQIQRQIRPASRHEVVPKIQAAGKGRGNWASRTPHPKSSCILASRTYGRRSLTQWQ